MNSVGAIITIILVVVWVVRGIASVAGDKSKQGKPGRSQDAIQRFQAEQARRRREVFSNEPDAIEVFDESQIQSMSQRGASQMGMAQRIELARQQSQQGDTSAALQQARQRAEQAAQRRQRAEQQRAKQERLARDRRRAQQQREQADRAARPQPQTKRRAGKPKRTRAAKTNPAGLPGIQAREAKMQARSRQRVHPGQSPQSDGPRKPRRKRRPSDTTAGPLDAASLRQAIVLKELLDKPLALRSPQDDRLS